MIRTEATLENMKRYSDPDVTTWSPSTGEERSANPGDYFMGFDGPMLDRNGDPMLLVRFSRVAIDVLDA